MRCIVSATEGYMHRLLSGLMLLCMSGLAQSEVQVIYDNGQTIALPKPNAAIQSAEPQPPAHYDFSQLFPIHTPSMRVSPPNSAHSRQLQPLQRLPGPLFLIGSDRLSQQWLIQHRDRLIALGAIGFLIEAESLADYQAVLALAGAELVIVPSSAEQLAKVLDLQTYPLLLTREGIQ